MKKRSAAVIILPLTLSACGTDQSVQPSASAAVTIPASIVSVEENNGNVQIIFSSDQVYTVSLSDIVPVTIKGTKASASDLKAGMDITVGTNGEISETYPVQISSVSFIASSGYPSDEKVHGVTSLYLQVLEDLWNTDPALNENISSVSVDLSDAPGSLSNHEKEAIAWCFASKHNAQPLTMSYEDLKSNGYLNDGSWEDGVLFTISQSDYSSSFSFNAQKWRGLSGAEYWNDCTVKLNRDGTWKNYQIGTQAVS